VDRQKRPPREGHLYDAVDRDGDRRSGREGPAVLRRLDGGGARNIAHATLSEV
jgi:hypothetical protein